MTFVRRGLNIISQPHIEPILIFHLLFHSFLLYMDFTLFCIKFTLFYYNLLSLLHNFANFLPILDKEIWLCYGNDRCTESNLATLHKGRYFMDFLSFLQEVFSNPMMFITVALTLGVIFVNGWTDAPNAIASCVTTRCLPVRSAILLSAVFNFLGVFIMTKINSSVAATISNMVDFGGDADKALIALCAALFSIVVYSVGASYLGIPTSESHSLIAGLTGSAIAIQGGLDAVNMGEWIKVIYGMVMSLALGFISGWLICRLVIAICAYMDRRKTNTFFRWAQVFGSAAMSFMHGAQDGQKFIGVLLLGVAFANGQADTASFLIPVWLMLLCSVVMGVGTSVGGEKIIKSVGMDMVHLEKYQGFAADLSAAACLLLSSLLGIPVSTTHTKTSAIMGVGAVRRLSAINFGVVKEMVLTWIFTFPGCGLISFIMAKIFMLIF